MRVRLKYKTKDGQTFQLKKLKTVKEARAYFNQYLAFDDNIVKVWLTHWGVWHEHLHQILKDVTGKDK